jgi:hypothetical protein
LSPERSVVAMERLSCEPTTYQERLPAVAKSGTAMSTNDYDQFSHALVTASTHDLLAIVLDPSPHDPVKVSESAYSFAVNRLPAELESLIDVKLCDNVTLIVGGHSAGGASAIDALKADMFAVPIAGYIGLDPYFVQTPDGNGASIKVPSLLWGFVKTTCGVNIAHSANAAYLSSSDGFRVFYRLSSKFSHCCFTDAGCLWVCTCSQDNQNLLHDIGVSVDQFINSLQRKSRFSRSGFPTDQFWLDPSNITIFVDDTLLRFPRLRSTTNYTNVVQSSAPLNPEKTNVLL